jgi:hypothetical protein
LMERLPGTGPITSSMKGSMLVQNAPVMIWT